MPGSAVAPETPPPDPANNRVSRLLDTINAASRAGRVEHDEWFALERALEGLNKRGKFDAAANLYAATAPDAPQVDKYWIRDVVAQHIVSDARRNGIAHAIALVETISKQTVTSEDGKWGVAQLWNTVIKECTSQRKISTAVSLLPKTKPSIPCYLDASRSIVDSSMTTGDRTTAVSIANLLALAVQDTSKENSPQILVQNGLLFSQTFSVCARAGDWKSASLLLDEGCARAKAFDSQNPGSPFLSAEELLRQDFFLELLKSATPEDLVTHAHEYLPARASMDFKPQILEIIAKRDPAVWQAVAPTFREVFEMDDAAKSVADVIVMVHRSIVEPDLRRQRDLVMEIPGAVRNAPVGDDGRSGLLLSIASMYADKGMIDTARSFVDLEAKEYGSVSEKRHEAREYIDLLMRVGKVDSAADILRKRDLTHVSNQNVASEVALEACLRGRRNVAQELFDRIGSAPTRTLEFRGRILALRSFLDSKSVGTKDVDDLAAEYGKPRFATVGEGNVFSGLAEQFAKAERLDLSIAAARCHQKRRLAILTEPKSERRDSFDVESWEGYARACSALLEKKGGRSAVAFLANVDDETARKRLLASVIKRELVQGDIESGLDLCAGLSRAEQHGVLLQSMADLLDSKGGR